MNQCKEFACGPSNDEQLHTEETLGVLPRSNEDLQQNNRRCQSSGFSASNTRFHFEMVLPRAVYNLCQCGSGSLCSGTNCVFGMFT